MMMIACAHADKKKHGKDRDGNQRFRCLSCGKTWIERAPRPLGDMQISMEQAVFALRLLLEGMSIRATERLTGLHRDTLCKLVVTVGVNCQRFLKAKIQGIPVTEVECDEMWGFVAMKEKTRQLLDRGTQFGDCYAYVAMERNTKLVLTYHVDKRCSEGTLEFIDNLYFATSGRFQISTDGYGPYQSAIPLIFNFNVDFSQVIKRFGGTSDSEGSKRYSPANIISVDKTQGCGKPDLDRACTSHSERLNLSLRMQIRRLTRLTNGHSKKWENHEAMLGLYFAWYNFSRVHTTIRKTPAMEQGLTDHVWTIEELLTEAAKNS
jgi:transposase-like protein/IS1 family transposase